MEYLVGLILGLVVAGFGATSGFDRDRAFTRRSSSWLRPTIRCLL
jgi:hypothetical protein